MPLRIPILIKARQKKARRQLPADLVLQGVAELQWHAIGLPLREGFRRQHLRLGEGERMGHEQFAALAGSFEQK